jgi:hypothetical protein
VAAMAFVVFVALMGIGFSLEGYVEIGLCGITIL